jgi:hypothetical protein
MSITPVTADAHTASDGGMNRAAAPALENSNIAPDATPDVRLPLVPKWRKTFTRNVQKRTALMLMLAGLAIGAVAAPSVLVGQAPEVHNDASCNFKWPGGEVVKIREGGKIWGNICIGGAWHKIL